MHMCECSSCQGGQGNYKDGPRNEEIVPACLWQHVVRDAAGGRRWTMQAER